MKTDEMNASETSEAMEKIVAEASAKWTSERPKTPGLRSLGAQVQDAVDQIRSARKADQPGEQFKEEQASIAFTKFSLFDPATTLLEAKVGISPVLALGDTIAEFEQAMLLRDHALALQLSLKIAWLARHCNLRRGDDGNTALLSIAD